MTNIVSDIGSGLAILKKMMRKVKERERKWIFMGWHYFEFDGILLLYT
jgi:hypothetical protein